jgi:predicted RNase H-like HicB family nuclease
MTAVPHLRLYRRNGPRGLAAVCKNEIVSHYAVVIHEEPEGGFWAEVPALPGCYSQGESIEELLENVREAISGVLEVMEAQGSKPESNIQILDVAV